MNVDRIIKIMIKKISLSKLTLILKAYQIKKNLEVKYYVLLK